MAKTTNILDLNNRLEKVEKENIAQNSYTSLKNKPKINGNLLTGDKTGTQLGLANAQDVGNLSDLNTTDKSSCVGAINELDAYTKRIYGSSIDISSYDSVDNIFVVPNDGMVVISVNDIIVSSKISLIDKGLNAPLGDSIANGQNQIRNSVSVIKGQQIYFMKTNAASSTAIYFPKVNPS